MSDQLQERFTAMLRAATSKAMNEQGCMTIGEVIDIIEAALVNNWENWNDPTVVTKSGAGLRNPMSYRGYYDHLAVEECGDPVEAREFVRTLRGCLGETFVGYKGGDYVMDRGTPLHVAPYGQCGEMVVGVEHVIENEYRSTILIATAEETF